MRQDFIKEGTLPEDFPSLLNPRRNPGCTERTYYPGFGTWKRSNGGGYPWQRWKAGWRSASRRATLRRAAKAGDGFHWRASHGE